MISPSARTGIAIVLLMAGATLSGCTHYCSDDLSRAGKHKRIEVCDGSCCVHLHADANVQPELVCVCSEACPCHRGETYR